MSRILYPIKAEPVLTADQQPEQVTESRWHQPFSEPRRLRAMAAAVAAASGLFAPVFTPVAPVTADEWQRPFSEPVRRVGRGAALASGPTPFVLTAETVTADKWYRAFVEPVRRVSRAAAQASGPTPVPFVSTAEIITADKWYRPFADPVRRGGLATAQHTTGMISPVITDGPCAFAEGPFQSGAFQICTDFPKWLVPLAEPVRRKGLPTALQGAYGYAPFTPAAAPSFGWFENLSEPVRVKPALGARSQQAFTFNPLPRVSFGWFGNLSDPVRAKPGLRASLQRFFTSDTAAIPASKLAQWFASLSEPVRQKIGLRTSLQQVSAWSPQPLAPTPSITGTMSAFETKDTFLAGAMSFDPPASGEIGIIETSPAGEVGIQTSVAPAAIASGSVSIRLV